MAKKPSSRKLVAVVLSVVLLAAIVLRINALPAGSITLPAGWHSASGTECFDNTGRPFAGHSGWPFISKSGQVCVTSENQLATSINIILFTAALLSAVAYVIYRLRLERKGGQQ
jgi:hypothetical protein